MPKLGYRNTTHISAGHSRDVVSLDLVRRGKTWWITNLPPYWVDNDGPYTDVGAYESKDEAQRSKELMEAVFADISI